MHFYGYSLVLVYVLVGIINSSFATELFRKLSDDEHENFPRIFGSIFSRPKPESEKQVGGDLKDHLGNVLRGGSIGFQKEFAPLAPLHGLINHAKKVISHPIIPAFGKPGTASNQPDSGWKEPEMKEPDYKEPEKEPDYKEPEYKEPEYKEPDYKEPEYKEPDYKEPDYKEPQPPVEEKPAVDDGENLDWEAQDPKDVKTNGPRWEDIGEDDYGYTTVPIEEIIQPRIRGKRRVESQVFRVPVEFISNAKPYAVKINSMKIP